MKPSTIFELLLIFLLIAFSAYARVIDPDEVHNRRGLYKRVENLKQSNLGVSLSSLKQATDSVNKYCVCNENICNCCRDFHIPLVQLKGPGCASLQYMQDDNLAVQLSFGENILTSTIVNGKNPKPVCVSLPGGFSRFCGRIYSIKRETARHFKACLGLELQSTTDLEASLRVSCFRFGPDGLKLRPAEPLPVVVAEAPDEDDDDIFSLGSDNDDGDDSEDDDDEEDATNLEANAAQITSSTNDEDDEDDDDVLGFSALLDIFTDEEESTTKNPKTSTPVLTLPSFTIPLLSTSVSPSANIQNSVITKKPAVENITGNEVLFSTADNNFEIDDEQAFEALESSTEGYYYSHDQVEVSTTSRNKQHIDDTAKHETLDNKNHGSKPVKTSAIKNISISDEIKPNIASVSMDAIKHDTKKHVKKLIKPKPVLNVDDDDNGADDVNDILGVDDIDEEHNESEYVLDNPDEEKKDDEDENINADDDHYNDDDNNEDDNDGDDNGDDEEDDNDDDDDEDNDEHEVEEHKGHLYVKQKSMIDTDITELRQSSNGDKEDSVLSALRVGVKEKVQNEKHFIKKR